MFTKSLPLLKAINSQSKWNNTISLELDHETNMDWRTAYILAARCTKSTMLINFQYRLLHRILPTNMFLTKIGIKQDLNCSFCNISIENLTRLFLQCEKVKQFWQNLTDHLQKNQLIPWNYPKNMAVFLGLKSDT